MAQPVKNDVLKEGWIKKSTTKLLKKWAEIYARIEDRRYLCLYTDDHTRKFKNRIDIGQATINYNVNKPKQFQIFDKDGMEHQFECGTIIDSTNWLINLKQINGIKPQPIFANIAVSDRRTSFSTQSDLDLIPTRTPTIASSTSHVLQMSDLMSSDFDEQKVAISQMDIDDQYMKAIFLYQNQEYEQCEQITRSVLRMDKHHPQALQLYRYLVDRERSQRDDSRSLFRRDKKSKKKKSSSNGKDGGGTNKSITKPQHNMLGVAGVISGQRKNSGGTTGSVEYSRSDADTSNYTLNSSDQDGTQTQSTSYRTITSIRSKSFAPVIIGRIDGALNLYYNYFPNVSYKTSNNHNKFKAFCEEQFDNDDDEIQAEIEGGLDDCILVKFDEDEDEINRFPFEYLIDAKKRNIEIFRVIHHCYLYKKPPPPLFEFESDDFFHVLEIFSTPIKMKPNSSFVRKTKNGLRLNKRKDNDDTIVLYLSDALRELIGISQNKKNERFNKDFACLLIESYGRYCIASEIEAIRKAKHNKKTRGSGGGTFVGSILNEVYNNMDIDADTVEHLENYIAEYEYDSDAIIDDINNNVTSDTPRAFGDYGYSNILSTMCGGNLDDDDEPDMELAKILKQHVYDEITICDRERIFGQIYYKQTIWEQDGNSKHVKLAKVVSNLRDDLEREYRKNYEGKVVAILAIDGEIVSESHRSYVHADSINDADVSGLRRLAAHDYNSRVFRFMSSNRFYWSLVPRASRNNGHSSSSSHSDGVSFFADAFNEFSDKICAPLTLQDGKLRRIRDNIFIFWVYIWSLSAVIKTYMQSGDITIPLQVDLVIIPAACEGNNTQNDIYIDNISERFNIYDQKFESVLCDPTDIASIRQKMEGLLMKCTLRMKSKEHRVVMIIDRRLRSEYFANKHCDRMFGYKPPAKYSQCDKRHEILNCIWNTASFIIPPPPKYENEQVSGAKDNNLFVLSYLIRKKSQFVHLFADGGDGTEQKEELRQEFEQQLSDDGKSESSYISSLQSASDMSAPQNLTTLGAKELAAKLRSKNLNNVQLKQLWQEATDAMNFNATIREITEFQAVQSYIMKMAMARKRDNVVATYLFYNGGYCRFEPSDLIRIVPYLFDLSCMNNYHRMIRDFKTFHDKLWEIDDEIWMKYKDEYLRSHSAMDQRIKIELSGTDPADRERIAKYCVWDKEKYAIIKEEKKEKENDEETEEEESKYDDIGNVEIITNDKHLKVLSMNMKLNHFMQWSSADQHEQCGMIIDRIKHTYYARYSGIQSQIEEDQYLWSVTQINNVNVTRMRRYEIETKFNEPDPIYTLRLIGGLFRMIEGKKAHQRVIATAIKLRTFLKWPKQKQKRKHKSPNGLLIKEILNNDYGDAFRETGVKHGWYIVTINSVDIRNQSYDQMKHFLQTKIYSKRNAEYSITCKYYEKNLLPSKAIKGRKNSYIFKK